jgi:hypothetical protein
LTFGVIVTAGDVIAGWQRLGVLPAARAFASAR